MIELQVNGVNYTGFTRVSCSRSIENISGYFDFYATTENVLNFPIKVGQSCKVQVNGVDFVTGFIERIDSSYDSNSHQINITGKDKTCDIVDSNAIGSKDLQSPISLKSIIESGLKTNNINDIQVIDNVGSIKEFAEGEFFDSSVGETLFKYFEKYARKRQVLLGTDGKGNILLQRAGRANSNASLNSYASGVNNILSANISIDHSERFNNYEIKSQGVTTSLDNFFDGVVSQEGSVKDSAIRASRQFSDVSTSSDSSDTLQELAKWRLNINKSRSVNYTAKVQGFLKNKTDIWQPNELVQVRDEFFDINTTLLIKSVEFNLSATEGSITTLELVDKDSYTLAINTVETQAKSLIFDDS